MDNTSAVDPSHYHMRSRRMAKKATDMVPRLSENSQILAKRITFSLLDFYLLPSFRLFHFPQGFSQAAGPGVTGAPGAPAGGPPPGLPATTDQYAPASRSSRIFECYISWARSWIRAASRHAASADRVRSVRKMRYMGLDFMHT